MKRLLLLITVFLVSCGGQLPSDAVQIDVKFKNQVTAPDPFKTVSITVEDNGQLALTITKTNRITEPSAGETYYSRSKKPVRITAQFPNQVTPSVVEFVVDEPIKTRTYSVLYEETNNGDFTVTCLTPTKPCPVLP
jgi:biopolymer transport protein ExbD